MKISLILCLSIFAVSSAMEQKSIAPTIKDEDNNTQFKFGINLKEEETNKCTVVTYKPNKLLILEGKNGITQIYMFGADNKNNMHTIISAMQKEYFSDEWLQRQEKDLREHINARSCPGCDLTGLFDCYKPS